MRQDIDSGALCQLLDLELAGPSPFALIYPSARPMSASLRVFIESLRDDA